MVFLFEALQNVKSGESDLKYHLIQSLYFINEKLTPQQGSHWSEITVSASPEFPAECYFYSIRFAAQKTETQIPRNKSQVFMNKKLEMYASLSFPLLFIPLLIWTFTKR